MEQLIKLQGIDTKLRDLNDLLGDLPSKVEGLNKQEEVTKNTLYEKKDRLKEVAVEEHKREVDINLVNGKIDKLKDQLFLVTNNKQYDAIMIEIDHLKEKKSNFENEAIAFLEEKETLKQAIGSMESELEDLSNDLSKRRKKLESAISDSAEEKNSLEKQRKENIANIDSNIISIYNKVMDARGGLAVVNVEGSGCGGCGAHIPPQKVTEVRAKSGIHRCDICGRFLFNQ
tara:strand:+ start:561 stop:1250 length:690 start_codon:yes stop_codon:yes gene_type:complete